jgi:hypothetical protein
VSECFERRTGARPAFHRAFIFSPSLPNTLRINTEIGQVDLQKLRICHSLICHITSSPSLPPSLPPSLHHVQYC